jgi:toxin ParE1/3/4
VGSRTSGDLATVVKLFLRPSAIADIRAAREYYEDASPGLGDGLATELDRLFGRLAAFPRSAPLVSGYEPIRRAVLRRFPYAVFFHSGSDRIDILRVVHTARSADAWRS